VSGLARSVGSGRRLSGRVVIATHNAGKLAEMRDLLTPHGIETVSAGELGLPEPEETGTTFAENAAIKARAAAMAAGFPALADDSGICVDALDGAPGIFSARWGGAGRDFIAAMARVDAELNARGVAEAERRAHFTCALAICWPDGEEALFEGRVFGRLVYPPRGSQGFGYDAMFLPDGNDRTFGEMSAAEKHGLPAEGQGLSHRARAFQALAAACRDPVAVPA